VVAAVSCTAQNSFPPGNLLAPVDSTLHEKKNEKKNENDFTRPTN